MKNKLFKKLICGSVAAVLTLGLLAGCGSTETKQSSSQSQQSSSQSQQASSQPQQASSDSQASAEQKAEVTYPIVTDEEITLTIATVPDARITKLYEKYENAPFYQKLMERLGVKLEFIALADSKAMELMLMSGDLPDMVWGAVYPGGKEVCIEDGIILPLNDYLDEYMPDYKATLELSKEYEKIGTTAAGYVWGVFQAAESYEQMQMGGLMVREDWLEDLGMEPPRTADQFYDMLKTFKEEKGAEVPLSATLSDLTGTLMKFCLSDAFGLVNTGWYQMDGTVHYGYSEKEVKDLFAFMNKLYKDGLLDPEFATLDAATVKSNALTGRTGCIRLLTGSVNSYRDSQEDPNYCLRGLAPLVQNEGDVARGGYGTGLDKGGYCSITTSCKYPEIAAMVLNYGYTEEGNLFYNFGTQGETWEYDAEGKPTFTDLIMNNPDGLAYGDACATLAHGNYPGPFIQQERYYQQALSVDEDRVKAWERYTVTDWANYCVPGGVQIPTELQDEYSKISSEISTYINEMVVAYITGSKSLDNFDSEYMATLKSLKIDRMIEIYQIAYDTYFN